MSARSNGNVLFLILIAVALFAALSYAVTQSTRSGGGNTSAEKGELNAAALNNYVLTLRTAMTRLRITNGCSREKLSFEPPPFSGSGVYFNPNAPTDKSCHIFHPNGGGVAELKPNAAGGISSIAYTANLGAPGTTLNFLVIVHGPSLEMCKALNKAASFNTPSFNPTTPGYYGQFDAFNGSFTAGGGIDVASGTETACLTGVGSGTPDIFYFASGPTSPYWYYSGIGPAN